LQADNLHQDPNRKQLQKSDKPESGFVTAALQMQQNEAVKKKFY
jgi:hypothetical protein